jgi:hypothetical protein
MIENAYMESPSPVPPDAAPETAGHDRLWGALAHFSAFTMYFTGFGHIVGPLIIWLWKRDTDPWVSGEAKEAMNFNISITLYAIGAAILIFVFIGVFLLWAIHIFQVVCIVIAGLKGADGRSFRYPLNLRLVK